MLKERRRDASLLNWIRLDHAAGTPLYKQISNQIREAIVTGRLAPSAYLPASRALALDLGISRVTATQAYDLLIAEGFLETRRGSGTCVAQTLAGSPLKRVVAARKRLGGEAPHTEVRPVILYGTGGAHGVAFQPGIPAFDAFPRLIWSRLLRRHGLRNDQFILDYAHKGGYAPLRQELAKYLGASRGVICTSEQIIVASTVRGALGAACSVLWPPGSGIIVEDPGYVVARRCFLEAGLQLRFAPVDENGLRTDSAVFDDEGCSGVYVTPAHQWPMECALSAPRRLQLLDWASRRDAWIIEDDYDSEFRFDSLPLATLHSLARGARVIYIGTFSKTLAPSIRTAYLVVPTALVPAFETAVYQRGTEPPLHVQAALSDFLAEGHFVRHISQMRKLYRRRRELLSAALDDAFGDRLRIITPPGGLQLLLELPADVPAVEASRAAAKTDLVVRDLTKYYVNRPPSNILHLGFSAVPEAEIAPGVMRLKEALSALL